MRLLFVVLLRFGGLQFIRYLAEVSVCGMQYRFGNWRNRRALCLDVMAVWLAFRNTSILRVDCVFDPIIGLTDVCIDVVDSIQYGRISMLLYK